MCSYGVPKGDQAKLSKYAMEKGRTEHREQTLSEVSLKQHRDLDAAQAANSSSSRPRKRAAVAKSKINRSDPASKGYTSFVWPRMISLGKSRRIKRRLTLLTAWQRDDGGRPFLNTFQATRRKASLKPTAGSDSNFLMLMPRKQRSSSKPSARTRLPRSSRQPMASSLPSPRQSHDGTSDPECRQKCGHQAGLDHQLLQQFCASRRLISIGTALLV